MFRVARIIKIAGTVFVAAILLGGCSTPKPPETVVEPVEPNPELSSLNWTNSAEPEEFPAPRPFQKPIAPVRTNFPPPAIVRQTAPPMTTWMPLQQWASAHHVGAPHRLSDLPVAAYAVGSKNGVMNLEIGSREATWNGVTINLGFAPQFIDGEICLNELDLQKNLEPLLCEPPLTFPKNGVIVIDPGHGGSNSGTHSVLDGRFEKEFTLDTALRLKPLLEAEGWTVFLTRTNDTFVANPSRPAFATAHHADLYISLHFNATPNPDVKIAGLETYCFTPTGLPSTVTRGYSDPWSEKLSSNDFDAQNLQLAVKMQTDLLRATGMEDRGVRHVRYIEVLRNQNCPAVLIENGYLSNPAEAKKIETADYRQKLAEAIAGALQ